MERVKLAILRQNKISVMLEGGHTMRTRSHSERADALRLALPTQSKPLNQQLAQQ